MVCIFLTPMESVDRLLQPTALRPSFSDSNLVARSPAAADSKSDSAKSLPSVTCKRRRRRRNKHKWLYNPMALINCCLTRTDSVSDMATVPPANSVEVSVPAEEPPVLGDDGDDGDDLLLIGHLSLSSSNPMMRRCRHPNTPDTGSPEPSGQISRREEALMPAETDEPVMIYEQYPMMPGGPDPSLFMRPMPEMAPFHTQIDYENCLVPDLLAITNSKFYWGKMDRYEAERLLEGKPEGTFLLRDSAQEDHLFSVSFRRFERSLHARIEHWQHRFSFDAHDPGVFSSLTVTGLIEYYKDPSHCMYFEPILTKPLHRTFTFSLQHLARVTICDQVRYDQINRLPLPPMLKSYLKEYHYRIKLRTRYLDESAPYRWLGGTAPAAIYLHHQPEAEPPDP